jgi:hypothetical protein
MTLLIVELQFRVGIELSGTGERALRCDSVFVWTIIEAPEVPAPQDTAMPSGGAKVGSFLAMTVS